MLDSVEPKSNILPLLGIKNYLSLTKIVYICALSSAELILVHTVLTYLRLSKQAPTVRPIILSLRKLKATQSMTEMNK